jgi:hypothetical protein
MDKNFEKELSKHLGYEGRLSERILAWKGWEKIWHERAKIFAYTFLIIALLSIIGFFLSKSATSSIQKKMAAQDLALQLQVPKEGPQIQQDQESQRLIDIVQSDTSLQKRFSGVVAEEEIIRSLPLSKESFSQAAKVLQEASLPLYEQFVQASYLVEDKKYTDALKLLDTMKEQSSSYNVPITFAAILLQKAYLLKITAGNFQGTVDELKAYLKGHPDIVPVLDSWFPDGDDLFTLFEQ